MSFLDHDFGHVATQVEQRLGFGDARGAIEVLRRYLAERPDHASAHALLAYALVADNRLHAAELEAKTALAAEPENLAAHVAMGRVLLARRKLDAAEEHLNAAQALDPSESAVYSALAVLHTRAGRDGKALEALERARSLEPNDPDILAQLAELHLDRGELDRAEALARESMEARATPTAIVALGHVALRRGDTKTAREHVGWALHDYPTDKSALHLLAAIKARESRLIGLWWRWATWMNTLGDARSIALLVGAFAIYRAATILMEGTKNATLIPLVELVWYAAVLYTWVGPGIFHWMLQKELSKVALRPDF